MTSPESFNVDVVASTKAHVQPELAAVICGLGPIPGQLDRTVLELQAGGSDVRTYTYDKAVIMNGDPKALPLLIDGIRDEILDASSEYPEGSVRIVGVSLGAGIGLNVQRSLGESKPGVYVAGGVNLARSVSYNPVFKSAQRAFYKSRVFVSDLHDAWADIDMYPDRPILPEGAKATVVLSQFDQVVPYIFANRNFNTWRELGREITVRGNRKIGHTACINSFDASIRELLEIADAA